MAFKFLKTKRGIKIKVDADLYSRLNQVRWYVTPQGYAANRHCKPSAFLHRWVVGTPVGKNCVDHINRNKLDNRRKNLRITTYSVNGFNRYCLHPRNTSGVTGVYYVRFLQKWRATMKVQYCLIHLGVFKKKIDAIRCRKQAVSLYLKYSNAIS